MEGVFLIGNGTVTRLVGQVGTTPACPQAKFTAGDVVRLRKLHWLGPEGGQTGVVATVVPPGFSPDWAWADLRKEPRPLMCQVGARVVSYILALESGKALLIKERYLIGTGQRGEFGWKEEDPTP
jgi:hypothetical protein